MTMSVIRGDHARPDGRICHGKRYGAVGEQKNRGQKQIIAEKIGSTVRVLELLGLAYEVRAPKHMRSRSNKSPRVVYVEVGKGEKVRIYNSYEGNTWANEHTGKPIASIKTVEDLYCYLISRM